jgi:single-stranded-DNA-specific exonuclease
LPDLDKAVTRIATGLERNERIAIFGDYDVDGLTATALLVHFLSQLEGEVCWYLPHRVREGYGLNVNALNHLHEEGVHLVITVDCGSSDHQVIEAASELGIDVVITDHHQPPHLLPEVSALVNPKRGCPNEGLRDLAGVGVAFYLATALRAHFRNAGRWRDSDQPNLKEYLDWVALGTLADMAPLSAANRILARIGLQVLTRTSRAGLQALKEICIQGKSQVSDWDVLFRLGPRLNAAGRLGDAGLSLRLLLSKDLREARELALQLDQLNKERQAEEHRLVAEALALVDKDIGLQESHSLVLASPGWHKGLLGLAASRLVERYNKPSILLTQVEGGWEGSGRSPGPFDLYRALDRCKEYLLRFGGHRQAAGLRLKDDQLPAFRASFEEVAKERIPAGGILLVLEVDSVAGLKEINSELMLHLAQMQPFGEGNPEPTFCLQDFEIKSVRPLKDRHLLLKLRQGNVHHDAIGFNLIEPGQQPPHPERLLFRARWNYWQGERRIQLHIVDYC